MKFYSSGKINVAVFQLGLTDSNLVNSGSQQIFSRPTTAVFLATVPVEWICENISWLQVLWKVLTYIVLSVGGHFQ